MGSFDGIRPVQRSHKPLPRPGVCLAGIQLDRHEGGLGAGEPTLPHSGHMPQLHELLLPNCASSGDLTGSKLGILAGER